MVKYEYDAWGKCIITQDTTPFVFSNQTLGQMNALRAVFWGSKVLIGETLSRALFVSGTAALARRLIDLMIPDLY